jgi:hypothetical protein
MNMRICSIFGHFLFFQRVLRAYVVCYQRLARCEQGRAVDGGRIYVSSHASGTPLAGHIVRNVPPFVRHPMHLKKICTRSTPVSWVLQPYICATMTNLPARLRQNLAERHVESSLSRELCISCEQGKCRHGNGKQFSSNIMF